MGQRGRGAVFLPDKFVFPGGAVDDADTDVPLTGQLSQLCRTRLAYEEKGRSSETLAATAIRELFEETGHILGSRDEWQDAPEDWSHFAARGYRPDASTLRFFFRAVTPPGRPRRFDARFFIAPAESLATDPDDMPDASEELSHLRWVSLDEARALDLAFVTQLVLGELSRHLPSLEAPDAVPFMTNDSLTSEVVWL